MSIASVTSSTGVNGATTSSKAGQGWGAMGAEDFVKLLTTQLQNQDPTEPVDNTQMLAQLAQFSSLSAANQSNTLLDQISKQIGKLGGTSA